MPLGSLSSELASGRGMPWLCKRPFRLLETRDARLEISKAKQSKAKQSMATTSARGQPPRLGDVQVDAVQRDAGREYCLPHSGRAEQQAALVGELEQASRQSGWHGCNEKAFARTTPGRQDDRYLDSRDWRLHTTDAQWGGNGAAAELANVWPCMNSEQRPPAQRALSIPVGRRLLADRPARTLHASWGAADGTTTDCATTGRHDKSSRRRGDVASWW
ncbi:hypothetical protein P171DRAFT_81439 [Karstenula rhodostoma CBS 690.94]|uniref:Uncharacterized protein n=1 Tax=Karstenula rhodostoma CBS 690.94 TaxID=1392251 RepID=A0A9P4PDJ2_9PLEO|nr:hypothetical protein P171DRAFT_81439 [Karstenula rhodostoma CBS 690.94]